MIMGCIKQLFIIYIYILNFAYHSIVSCFHTSSISAVVTTLGVMTGTHSGNVVMPKVDFLVPYISDSSRGVQTLSGRSFLLSVFNVVRAESDLVPFSCECRVVNGAHTGSGVKVVPWENLKIKLIKMMTILMPYTNNCT